MLSYRRDVPANQKKDFLGVGFQTLSYYIDRQRDAWQVAGNNNVLCYSERLAETGALSELVTRTRLDRYHQWRRQRSKGQ